MSAVAVLKQCPVLQSPMMQPPAQADPLQRRAKHTGDAVAGAGQMHAAAAATPCEKNSAGSRQWLPASHLVPCGVQLSRSCRRVTGPAHRGRLRLHASVHPAERAAAQAACLSPWGARQRGATAPQKLQAPEPTAARGDSASGARLVEEPLALVSHQRAPAAARSCPQLPVGEGGGCASVRHQVTQHAAPCASRGCGGCAQQQAASCLVPLPQLARHTAASDPLLCAGLLSTVLHEGPASHRC